MTKRYRVPAGVQSLIAKHDDTSPYRPHRTKRVTEFDEMRFQAHGDDAFAKDGWVQLVTGKGVDVRGA